MYSIIILFSLLSCFNGYVCQRANQNQLGINILGLASSLQNLAGDIISNLQQGNPISIELSTNFGDKNSQQNQNNQAYPVVPQQQGPGYTPTGQSNFPDYNSGQSNFPGGRPGFGASGWPGYRPQGGPGFGPGFGLPPNTPGFGPPPGKPGFGRPPGRPAFGPPGRPEFEPPPGRPNGPGYRPGFGSIGGSGFRPSGPPEKPNTGFPPGYPNSGNADEEKDRQKIAGYIDGDFPVILLEENDIR